MTNSEMIEIAKLLLENGADPDTVAKTFNSNVLELARVIKLDDDQKVKSLPAAVSTLVWQGLDMCYEMMNEGSTTIKLQLVKTIMLPALRMLKPDTADTMTEAQDLLQKVKSFLIMNGLENASGSGKTEKARPLT